MQIKFQKKITDYDYLVMFDLASKVSGICVWSVKEHRPISTKVMKVTGDGLPVYTLYELIDAFFTELRQTVSLDRALVAKEAMPIQAGKFSTIQTLIALARSHAILDFYLEDHNIDCYDTTGIYPASTRAYFKKIHPMENGVHEEKEDINKFVVDKYSLQPKTLDESDAIFLAETLIDSKWNKDIDDEIREVKRHKKTLKAPHAIAVCDDKIQFLLSLKI